ncbi:MAG: proline--tRNA ligase [Leptospiraceae bacterium]|nr:proline--tRNA ligase [Leptospiraceae bacterium]
MKASRMIIDTLRDVPADASVASHQLMLRAGLMRSSGAGLYNFLPMGLRVLRKIEAIVRAEMEAAGAREFLLPILTPAELWQKSGRWDAMGREMFRLKDRHDNEYALGPTHEEAFSQLLGGILRSWKDLPVNVYQIHTKFRDEIRPRFGVIRSREFIMKDAYSFDLDAAGLEETYQLMRQTYRRIFERMGLDTIAVEADSGTMGGSASEEFMVASSIGEEVLLVSDASDYKSNQEKTPVVYSATLASQSRADTVSSAELEKVHTPGIKTIQEVAQHLKKGLQQTMKAVAMVADEKPVMVFIRGDRELNEVKLRNYLKASELFAATDMQLEAIGTVAGFIGPLDLAPDVQVLWDSSLTTGEEYVIGANQKDYHYCGYTPPAKRQSIDLALAVAGDPSPDGQGTLKEMRGIELGHIFKLGEKYSRAFDIQVLDKNGKAVTPLMGCYGIGINRAMATIIEQNHDEYGICWPVSVAPYAFVLVGISSRPEDAERIDALYTELLEAGLEIIYDDRDARPGVKFKDAELIGYPVRLTAGKSYIEKGELEIQLRRDAGQKDSKTIFKGSNAELIQHLKELQNTLQPETGKRP